MNEFKGTQGKWDYSDGDNSTIDIVLPNNTTISVDRYDRYGGGLVGERSEMKANALLISKAPEMLNLLNQSLRQLQSYGDLEPTFLTRKIEKLIKEATEI